MQIQKHKTSCSGLRLVLRHPLQGLLFLSLTFSKDKYYITNNNSPKNIVKRKARCGRNVPDGPGRFDPTSEELKAILDRPAAPEPKKKKPEPKKKKPAAKENKPVKKKTAVNQIKSTLIQ